MTVPQIPGVRVRSRRGGTTWEVRAGRIDDAAALAPAAVGTAALDRLELTLDRWRPPVAGWFGRPGIAGVAGLQWEATGSGVRVRIELTAPMDAGLVVSAVVRCLRPTSRDEGPELTFAPGLGGGVGVLGGQVRDVLLADEKRDAHVRRCDTLVVAAGAEPTDTERAGTVVVDGSTWQRDGQPFDVCVDPAVHRPIGRRSVGPAVAATATVVDGRVMVTAPDLRAAIDDTLTGAQVGALRAVGAVRGDGLPAHLVHQLHACGLLVVDTSATLPDAEDPLAWQVPSVHERRHALRQFGPAAALDAWPTVSVVLVTHRPDHLDHAFAQLRGLRYPRLEVVVGVHGDRIDVARVRDLAAAVPYPVTIVPVDGSLTLGAALQSCCDRAEGALLTKMDDDDFYGPEHVWDLVLARQYSGAQIVGKALDWVYVESQDSTVFRPVYAAEKYADFVAGGTMLISRADLAAVGGWRPVPKSVDRALLDRVLADGGLVYRTHGLGYVYVRHSAGHTATVRDEHFLTKTVATYPGLIRDEVFGTAGGA